MISDSPNCIIFVGTRPELIKLQPVIKVLRRIMPADRVRVVFTGQHTDLLTSTDPAAAYYADDYLNLCADQPALSDAFTSLQGGISNYLRKQSGFGYVLVQGDTSTAAAAALSSRLCGWKVMHVEAGLRTYQDEPFPEEQFRRIISCVSSFHFAPTALNARNLRSEGVPDDQMMTCGNTGIDHLIFRLNQKNLRSRTKFNTGIRVLVTLHRRENRGEGVHRFAELLKRISEVFPNANIEWILHPSVQNEIQLITPSERISLLQPLTFDALVEKLLVTDLLITDSGGLQEEAVTLGIPFVVYRNVTERKEAILEGYPALVSTDHDLILHSLPALLSASNTSAFRYTYGDGYASHDIAAKMISAMNVIPQYKTVIIGGGPGGTGPLLSAVRMNKLEEFSKGGLAVIEKGNVLVRGQLSSYKINSDTLSNVFFECLDGENNPLAKIPQLAEFRDLFSSYSNRHIPLDSLKEYLEALGFHLEQLITAVEGNHVYYHSEVTSVCRLADGRWMIHVLCNGTPYNLIASQVIMSPGGRPERLTTEKLFANKQLTSWRNPVDCVEVLYSDDVLRGREDKQLSMLLQKYPDAEVIVLGSSHSAFSSAWYLKNNFTGFKGEIIIAGLDEPAIFYQSAEDARNDGYTAFDEKDICPVTQRVFRLGGLRGDGRNLFRSIKGLGSERVSNVSFRNLQYESVKPESCDSGRPYLVVIAYGYRFNMPEVFDVQGTPVKFKGRQDGHWVNSKSALLDANGHVVPNLYAVGLATGFLPSGELGGEISFTRQTNGLWFYQHLLGELLVKELTP